MEYVECISQASIDAGEEVDLMEKGSVFKSNRSQAVRLPKAAAFPEDVGRVDIVMLGRARLLVPEGEAWDTWFEGPDVPEDFMNEREQPAPRERESL
ncbi:type II toxin-antitoxin system VapB family antitoxin [Achromobacter aloeverae]